MAGPQLLRRLSLARGLPLSLSLLGNTLVRGLSVEVPTTSTPRLMLLSSGLTTPELEGTFKRLLSEATPICSVSCVLM